MLDPFSFSSGHALHAVSFTIIMASYSPRMALALVPFTGVVTFSRVVLGLHDFRDVLAGAALGMVIGGLSVWLFRTRAVCCAYIWIKKKSLRNCVHIVWCDPYPPAFFSIIRTLFWGKYAGQVARGCAWVCGGRSAGGLRRRWRFGFELGFCQCRRGRLSG
uniref:Phosphatidic acid phosphatase type 2/haloperoxidase domain-containing protein n=1 Tax=blood disease bacterium R229 TaxID=741978 RepID=G2ZXA0_9RALS|nr:conserved hypothetical protein [blood disease bacterium R229]